MTPDPITPGGVAPFMTWWKMAASFVGGLIVIIGGVTAAVNHVVSGQVEDAVEALEEQMEELAQAVVEDDIEWQAREIEMLERRVERLEAE